LSGSAKSLTKLLKSGAGKQGYCKLCSFDDPRVQDDFDKRVLDYKPDELNEWLASRVQGFKPVNRQTIYRHRKHVQNPQDKLVQATRKRDLEHGKQPAKTTDEEFLDAVVSLGYVNAMADPESVTIDHALKATQIKAQSKKQGQAHQTLVAIFTGSAEADIIEGEVKEV